MKSLSRKETNGGKENVAPEPKKRRTVTCTYIGITNSIFAVVHVLICVQAYENMTLHAI